MENNNFPYDVGDQIWGSISSADLDLDGILEPFIVGTEPYNNNIIKLDSLSSINNNSISGTGSLLIQ